MIKIAAQIGFHARQMLEISRLTIPFVEACKDACNLGVALGAKNGIATRKGSQIKLRIIGAAHLGIGAKQPQLQLRRYSHARILSELVALGGPAGWEVVAREVWPDEDDAWVLRKRWDVNLGRLRGRLREGGVRTDLVRAAGTGQVELVLRHNDTLEDRS